MGYVIDGSRKDGCIENRGHGKGMFAHGCEFDGKLSAVVHKGRTFIYARGNMIHGKG